METENQQNIKHDTDENEKKLSEMTLRKIVIWAILHVLITVGLGVWVLIYMDYL